MDADPIHPPGAPDAPDALDALEAAAPDPFAGRSLRHRSLPVFEGRASRRHADVADRRLALRALLPVRGLGHPDVFAQFVGFPRSGHSLLGALIDAHPQATVAHELDAMGLFRAGLSPRRVARLAARNAAAFAAHGKWWNGFAYAVEGAPPKRTTRVIGDKKGDWAARWCGADPNLLPRFEAACAKAGMRPRWILVTRAPADNIATMTLRRGGAYDRAVIAARAEGRPASEAIAAAQAAGDLPRAAADAMIADYHALCRAIVAMKAHVPDADWLEIEYGAFTRAPQEGLARIAAFLGLEADPDWARAAAALVRPGGSRSRDRLDWAPHQRAALRALSARFDFLAPYRDDPPGPHRDGESDGDTPRRGDGDTPPKGDGDTPRRGDDDTPRRGDDDTPRRGDA